MEANYLKLEIEKHVSQEVRDVGAKQWNLRIGGLREVEEEPGRVDRHYHIG